MNDLPYVIVLACIDAVWLTMLLAVIIAPKPRRRRRASSHGVKFSTMRPSDKDRWDVCRGAYHVQEFLPGVYVAGSVVKQDEYSKGPRPYHRSELLRMARPDLILRDGDGSFYTEEGTGQIIDERTEKSKKFLKPAAANQDAPPIFTPDPEPVPRFDPGPDSFY